MGAGGDTARPAAASAAAGTRIHPGLGRASASPVPPGTGWPGDPATAATPVAADPAAVARLAAAAPTLAALDAEVSVCRACPRLVAWREEVAAAPRRSFAGEAYWGRPVTGWGPPAARVLLLGLAPAAHGGNRTGRVFTGDRSGDWLFAALHRVGLAATATSVAAGDGQRLDVAGGPGLRISAAVHCAPPANAPTPAEIAACRPWLEAELDLLARAGGPAVVVALGGLAWAAALSTAAAAGFVVPRPRPRFGHAREVVLARAAPGAGRPVTLLGCYHPSQQNTSTGVLTRDMLDAVLGRAVALAVAFDLPTSGAPAPPAGHLPP